MKKSQITIFIVLGIVVAIIFGLVFFIQGQSSDIVLEKKINKVYGDFLSATNIKYIADNCLDRSVKDALLLVGLQGGRIYDHQINKGHHIVSFYDVIPFNYTGRNPNGTIYNVSYGIKAPVNMPYLDPPSYPYPGSLVRNFLESQGGGSFINPNNQTFANVPNPRKFTILADLCNKRGPNDPYTVGAGINCETYSTRNESIQEYIRKYIEQNVKDCINFTFKATSKYNISAEDLSLKILIGEEDILVSLNYPIEISIKNKPPITKYLDFNIRPKIRLKMLHEIAFHLIGYNPHTIKTYAESNNIFFDITRDDPNDCYKGRSPCITETEGINVFKLQNYCLNHNHCGFSNRHYDYSDILIIEDNKSIVDGKPYRFQFAIENRRPALDFIDESVEPDKYYYWYINTTYGAPGGLNLTELYSNDGIGHPTSDSYNILVELGNPVDIYPLGIDPDEDDLMYTYYIRSGGGSITRLSPKDAEFSSSVVGDTILRVNVSDDGGLYDYQDVVIRVV